MYCSELVQDQNAFLLNEEYMHRPAIGHLLTLIYLIFFLLKSKRSGRVTWHLIVQREHLLGKNNSSRGCLMNIIYKIFTRATALI